MNEDGLSLEWSMHREALDRLANDGVSPDEPPSLHHTELPEAGPGQPLQHEWNYYRREVARLLADGQEGRWALIKGEELVGVWDTREEAKAVAVDRYLLQPVLIQQIRSREPLVRGPSVLWRCPS